MTVIQCTSFSEAAVAVHRAGGQIIRFLGIWYVRIVVVIREVLDPAHSEERFQDERHARLAAEDEARRLAIIVEQQQEELIDVHHQLMRERATP